MRPHWRKLRALGTGFYSARSGNASPGVSVCRRQCCYRRVWAGHGWPSSKAGGLLLARLPYTAQSLVIAGASCRLGPWNGGSQLGWEWTCSEKAVAEQASVKHVVRSRIQSSAYTPVRTGSRTRGYGNSRMLSRPRLSTTTRRAAIRLPTHVPGPQALQGARERSPEGGGPCAPASLGTDPIQLPEAPLG